MKVCLRLSRPNRQLGTSISASICATSFLFAACLVVTSAASAMPDEKETRGKNSTSPGEENTVTPTSVVSTTSPSNVTESSSNSTAQSAADKKRCKDLIGTFVNGKFQGLEVTYDAAQLLEKHGGAPGKVNATWTEKEDAPIEEKDLEKKPFPDADPKYWLYKYGDTDYKYYIRIEHAVHRFSGTPKEFLEIRGTLYFTPDDFCGMSRKAEYTVDERGLTFDVSHEYCNIGAEKVECAPPNNCQTDYATFYKCVAAPSYALLASLVG